MLHYERANNSAYHDVELRNIETLSIGSQYELIIMRFPFRFASSRCNVSSLAGICHVKLPQVQNRSSRNWAPREFMVA